MCLICLENVTATAPWSLVLRSRMETGQRKGEEEPEERSGQLEASKQNCHHKLQILRITPLLAVFPRLAGQPPAEKQRSFSSLCSYLWWFGVQITGEQ